MVGQLATRPPRNVWDLLDDAFDLYRGRFLHFAALAAALYLPGQALLVLLGGEVHARFLLQKLNQDESTRNLIDAGEWFLQAALLQIPLAVSTVFLGVAVAESVWGSLHGRSLVTADVLKNVLRQAPRLLLIALFCGVIHAVAVCFFGIGLWVSEIWFLTLPAALQIERLSLAATLRRIKRRQSAHWLRVLGLILLLTALLNLLHLGILALLEVFYGIVPSSQSASNKDLRENLFNLAAGSLCRDLLAPIGALAATLLYVDQRVRHDALDLVTAAETAGIPLAPEPPLP